MIGIPDGLIRPSSRVMNTAKTRLLARAARNRRSFFSEPRL